MVGRVLERIGKVAREHQDALLSVLNQEERDDSPIYCSKSPTNRDWFEGFTWEISEWENPKGLEAKDLQIGGRELDGTIPPSKKCHGFRIHF
jgi:hypothetical protein